MIDQTCYRKQATVHLENRLSAAGLLLGWLLALTFNILFVHNIIFVHGVLDIGTSLSLVNSAEN